MTKGLTLLLADDDFDDSYFFKQALQSMSDSVKVNTVSDGEQLMKYLRANIDNLPAIIFLDLNMPRKNGFDCLNEIKNDDKLKSLPVIIYSTSDEKDVINILYKKGAQFYIQKPDNFSKLKKVLQKAITFAQEIKFLQPKKEDFILTA